jgi:hypothetical protein
LLASISLITFVRARHGVIPAARPKSASAMYRNLGRVSGTRTPPFFELAEKGPILPRLPVNVTNKY